MTTLVLSELAPFSGATVSPCELFRYHLWRNVGPEPRAVGFLMLNPSTADADEDDPTIRRCIGFARAWGFGRLEVGNLFAFRSTNPGGLYTAADPIGPENDRHLLELAERCEFLVCAWGNKGAIKGRDLAVQKLLRGKELRALRLTRLGMPEHPLYLPSSLEPFRWAPT